MNNKKFHFFYGFFLIIVGICVFFRIPEVVQQIEHIEFLKQKINVVKFCLYMLGIFLIIAGSIRIHKNYSSLKG